MACVGIVFWLRGGVHLLAFNDCIVFVVSVAEVRYDHLDGEAFTDLESANSAFGVQSI